MHLLSCVSVKLDKQQKEEMVDESSSSHCFTHLEAETVYRISVHSRLGSAEGAAVSILHPTGQTRGHCNAFTNMNPQPGLDAI